MRLRQASIRFSSLARSAWAWLAAQIEPRDVLLLAGLALVASGLAQVWVPAAYIVPGLVLVGCALWPAVLELITVCRAPMERKGRT